MDGAFFERLAAGKTWEQDVYRYLVDNPRVVSVAFNGTEHTHPDFVSLLRQNSAKSAALLRYQPDGVFLRDDGEVFHFEAKHSSSIERTAWEVYHAIAAVGASVIVFVKHPRNGYTYMQTIEKMRLFPGSQTVARFPKDKRFPVHDEWIHRPGRTPYREIDFDSMRVFDVGNTSTDTVSA